MPDLALALLCARAAGLAYELDDAKRQALAVTSGLAEIARIDADDDARMSVFKDQFGRVLWAFQGTQFTDGEVPSIIENLETGPIWLDEECAVMQGYHDQLLALRPHFAELPKPDIVTGHSMGGCIASLAQEGDIIVTFGAPQCANQGFWDAARLLPIRYVRAADFGPTWPEMALYVPPNDLIWLHDDPLIAETIAARPGLNISIADHSIDRYIADLATLQVAA